jgi:hypothetical protein
MGVAFAQGSQLGGKVLTGADIIIGSDQTIDHDLYVFGQSVVSNGTIAGDVVAAGGSLVVDGVVNGDVIAAGGRVTVAGQVTGDVRAAGGQISIAGTVSEDVLASGGSVSVSGNVGQDLIAYGGSVDVAGAVAGSTLGSAGVYTRTGTVAGSDGIIVTGRGEAPFPTPTPAPEATATNLVLDGIRQFLAVVLVAVLALWLVPRAFGKAESNVRERPVPSFGWGVIAIVGYLVLVIVIVLLAVLLAILFGLLGFGTLVAIDIFGAFFAIAGATLALIVAAAYVADAIVGVALARLVAVRAGWLPAATEGSTRTELRWTDIGLVAGGVLVVVVLTSLPIVGWLVKLLVVLLGLGAIWLALRDERPVALGTQGAQAPTPPAPAS